MRYRIKSENNTRKFSRRSALRSMTAAGLSLGLPGWALATGKKALDGITLNVSTFSAAYPLLLRKWIPAFEALTGARVNFDTPSFPVYNQRTDLELSTKGAPPGSDVGPLTDSSHVHVFDEEGGHRLN